ncbi:MAG TPA: histidine--tRNA ligase [Verrucomicrobiales bacterium]|nr:histidine--tRNA ligase [Verrucomicrobiales bacterium]
MEKIQSLKGFRDFYPDICAVRNYVFAKWRDVARRYGMVEYEIPVLEPTELYRRKSGDEIVKQLFHFKDGGDREVALRPETTPSLARMAAARQRDYRKPIKWFQIGSCFRYEQPQKGRGREFYQFNADILGEKNNAADADLIALAIDVMLGFGFRSGDFRVRLSDRNVWPEFLRRENVSGEHTGAFLQIIDKLEREKEEVTAAKLAEMGTALEAVRTFIASRGAGYAPLESVMADLKARGLEEYVEVDLNIVRGLAYYTGTVFEVFDCGKGMRAVAGGGRYDNLCQLIGGVDLAAAGFAMGDMVISDLIRETPHANAQMQQSLTGAATLDLYVITASEARRAEALATVQALRAGGHSVDFSYNPDKVGKQFQAAETLRARLAVVIGDEYPAVKIKDLAARTEQSVEAASLIPTIRALLSA